MAEIAATAAVAETRAAPAAPLTEGLLWTLALTVAVLVLALHAIGFDFAEIGRAHV